MKVLLKMKHGLGDNAQFTIVLRHIQRSRPDWIVDMEVGAGKASYFRSATRRLFLRNKEPYAEGEYDRVIEGSWSIPKTCRPDLPATKPTRFLQEVLGIDPIESLYRGYQIEIAPEEAELTDQYVASLPPRPLVLLHYLATTLRGFKNLSHEDAWFICDRIQEAGCIPVILDWKSESPLPDGKRIFNPGLDNPIWQGQKSSSAGTLASLIRRARLFIGIDSGPLHVAGATNTPTIGVWRKHHPVNFFDLCDNVTHLVPRRGCRVRGDNAELGKSYFEQAYRFVYYNDLRSALSKSINQSFQTAASWGPPA